MLRQYLRLSNAVSTPFVLLGRSRTSITAVRPGNSQSYSLLSFLPSKKTLVPRNSQTPPAEMPPPKYLNLDDHCTFEYVDIPPTSIENVQGVSVTLVMLHGAPGSYQDFRYLIPLVQLPGVRIIGINLPGYAGSSVNKFNYLDAISALPAAKLTLEAVRKLCASNENIFLVGHSFGAHTAISMAALDATRKLTADGELNPAINFQGMALLAPVGCSSHHVMRPRANAVVIKMLKSQNRVIVGLASRIVKAIYTKLLRFPADSPPDPFVAAVVRAGTTDFELMREQVALLRTLGMPTLVAWSQSDEYIQEEIPRELERLCYTGPRLSFASGGHNIQKTRADQIAPVLNSWVANVLSGTAVKSSADIQQLP